MTKEKFLTAYRDTILQSYDWAKDTAKLDRFMESVKQSITTKRSTWTCEGSAVSIAWRQIGGKGKVTLKALRALT